MNKALDLLREIRPSIPKEVLELWCKDRDAFLASHPAVEQAGGDERAAFEQWEAEQISFVLRQIGSMDTGDIDGDDVDLRFEDADGRDTGCDVSIVEYADKAANLIEAMLADHAALAQPSPTLPPFAEKVLAKLRRFYDCAEDFESGGVDIGRHWLDLLTQLGLLNRVQRSPALWEISQQGEDFLGTPHPSPAQAEKAEAERQEVVDFNPYRYHAEKIRQRADGAASAYEAGRSALGYMEDIAESALIVRNGLDELSAQHERITAKLHDALDESDGDRWKMRSERDAANARLHEVATACATAEQERDAALAEVERLRQFERICEGLPQDAIDGGWTVQGIRGYAKRLEDQLKSALARVAELEKQEPVAHLRASDLERLNQPGIAGSAGSLWNGPREGFVPLYAAPVAQPEETPGEILAAKLIETWVTKHGKPAPWSTAVEITAVATNMPNDERDRLLALDDDVDAKAQHSVPEGWVQSLPLKDHQPCNPNEDRANGYTIPIYSRPALVEEALRKLRAVLCDPIGNVVIDGSDGDREEVQQALGMLAAAPGKEGL
ncbi:hypothetical protein [Pseudomonas aeruginosa]|uniref:hypothetical protein n=1 Tax=Pseudomonas aeruginosa TaxID=287 RepID=UPI00155E4169|nr:hypothetical protein [Pseudomonas aeruginosa]